MVGFDAFERSVSARKQRANRRNAKKSTGPTSEEGKERSSRNATQHGIFCNAVLLPGEDRQQFAVLLHSFIHDLQPQTMLELSLVEQIVSAQWRIRRCNEAEGIALGAIGNEANDFWAEGQQAPGPLRPGRKRPR